MHKQKCKVCGTIFETDKSACYCSLACADIGKKKKREQWKERNPEYYRHYFKKRVEDNPNYPHEKYTRFKAQKAERILRTEGNT